MYEGKEMVLKNIIEIYVGKYLLNIYIWGIQI